MLIPAWVDGASVALDKLEVHRRGLRHPAVSVFVLDAAGRVLIQQRALAKYHTPGLWANTCCTHPHLGEAMRDCAERRLREELGICGLDLVAAGVVEYRAEVGGGMVEHEVVSIFTALAPDGLAVAPDPAEVAAVRWVGLEALAVEAGAAPERFTPWLRIYLAEHREAIFGRAGRGGAAG